MNLENFLIDLKSSCSKISYLCIKHMFNKKFDLNNQNDIEDIEIKEFLINFDNYDKLLNDFANIIYNRFESSKEEIFMEICKYLNEDYDNKYFFEYKLTRVLNQDPFKYLNMDDKEMQEAAIERVYDKLEDIENSKYYQNNKGLAQKDIDKLKKSLEMVKMAVGIR